MKSKIRLGLITIGLLLTYSQFAQQPDSLKAQLPPVEGSSFVYFDILAVLNPSMGIQLGYEHNVWNNLNLVGEATYQIPSWSDMRGYKLMVSPRYYLSSRFFMGLEAMYKNIHADRESWFDLTTHFRRLEYTSRIVTKAAAIQLGFTAPLRSNPMILEFAVSIGSGVREVTHEGTAGLRVLENPIFGLGWNIGKRNIPYVNLAAKFKFLVSKP